MAEKSCSNQGCTKESCEGCPSKKTSFLVDQNIYSNVRHVIGVVSGKGGVGKSMVTATLANRMAEKGFRVGILDADITGPSIPKMYGLHGPAVADDNGIIPVVTENGIKVMSLNLLVPNEEDPVIWRGPVIANMVKQFWSDVIWGELYFLFVDMPPGTGDVPLTVFQSLPVEGIVIVSSPKDLVRMIVTKAFNMAKAMKIPVLGIVSVRIAARRSPSSARAISTRLPLPLRPRFSGKCPSTRLWLPWQTAENSPSRKIRTWMRLWKSSTSSTVRIPKTTKNKKKKKAFRRKTGTLFLFPAENYSENTLPSAWSRAFSMAFKRMPAVYFPVASQVISFVDCFSRIWASSSSTAGRISGYMVEVVSLRLLRSMALIRSGSTVTVTSTTVSPRVTGEE